VLAESFTRRKKYDTPVQMSRLPQVHEYICGVVTNLKAPLASVRPCLLKLSVVSECGLRSGSLTLNSCAECPGQGDDPHHG
jgi:hypothetical protein